MPSAILRLTLLTTLILATGCAGGGANFSPVQSSPVWMVTEGLQTPESAYFDEASGVVFISNVAGDPAQKDGNGWISKVTPDGRIITAQWVTGLNAPKGQRSHGGILYVSDLTEVVAIDIGTGQVKQRISCEGAGFLNDVAAGADGTIYVSDMIRSRIYQIRNGAATVFAEGPELEWPNGLLVDGEKLICGGWGKPRGDASTAIGHLYSLDLKTKQKTLITPNPLGNLDGIERDGSGGYFVSDWPNGKLFHVNKAGAATTLLTASRGTADLAYLIDRRLLLLPRMIENRLEAYQMKAQR